VLVLMMAIGYERVVVDVSVLVDVGVAVGARAAVVQGCERVAWADMC